jgi:hypothetical protein
VLGMHTMPYCSANLFLSRIPYTEFPFDECVCHHIYPYIGLQWRRRIYRHVKSLQVHISSCCLVLVLC